MSPALSISIVLIQLDCVSVGENLHQEKYVRVCVCFRRSKDKKDVVSLPPLPGDAFLFLFVSTAHKNQLHCPPHSLCMPLSIFAHCFYQNSGIFIPKTTSLKTLSLI